MKDARRILDAERRELLQRLGVRQDVTVDGHGDPADLAVAHEARERDADARARDLLKLRLVDAALGRLSSDTFGVCVQCGDPIAPARLRVMPWIPVCRPCAEESEREAERARRRGRAFGDEEE